MLKKTLLLTLSTLVFFSCSQLNDKTSQVTANNTSILNSTKALVTNPNVKLINFPNRNESPSGTKIDATVLHHSANTRDAKSIGDFFLEPSVKVSSHYTITVKEKSTLKELANDYLDSESRWNELKLLKPNFNETSSISTGSKINLPLNFKYYLQLKK